MAERIQSHAAQLMADLRSGSSVALARAITAIETGGPLAEALLDGFGPVSQTCERIGITGPPGAGKSTLADALVAHMRSADQAVRIGVIAVDPSSPFTGGALLGDRFRMHAIGDDAGVFIRSMAARGALGGLAEATEGAADLFAAAGFARVVIETVGVGQSEVDIAAAADCCVVVLTPEGGDSVQALKAGIMEVADIVVVNKADHPRAARFLDDVRSGLELRAHRASGWEVPLLEAIATQGRGVAELSEAIVRHASHIEHAGLGPRIAVDRALRRLRQLWLAQLECAAFEDPRLRESFERLASSVAQGRMSLPAAVHALIEDSVRCGGQTPDMA